MNLMLLEPPRPARGETRVEHIERNPGFSIEALMGDLSFGESNSPLFGNLVSLSRRVLGDEHLARDAVQESLLSLWLLGGVSPSNVGGWLKGAVVRRSLHLARCRSRRQRREVRVAEQHREPSDRDDPRQSMEAQELTEIIMNALQAIDPDFREVLLLSLDDQMDYASMAKRLGVPIGTIRSRLSRSRRALRTVLLRTMPEEYRLLLPS